MSNTIETRTPNPVEAAPARTAAQLRVQSALEEVAGKIGSHNGIVRMRLNNASQLDEANIARIRALQAEYPRKIVVTINGEVPDALQEVIAPPPPAVEEPAAITAEEEDDSQEEEPEEAPRPRRSLWGRLKSGIGGALSRLRPGRKDKKEKAPEPAQGPMPLRNAVDLLEQQLPLRTEKARLTFRKDGRVDAVTAQRIRELDRKFPGRILVRGEYAQAARDIRGNETTPAAAVMPDNAEPEPAPQPVVPTNDWLPEEEDQQPAPATPADPDTVPLAEPVDTAPVTVANAQSRTLPAEPVDTAAAPVAVVPEAPRRSADAQALEARVRRALDRRPATITNVPAVSLTISSPEDVDGVNLPLIIAFSEQFPGQLVLAGNPPDDLREIIGSHNAFKTARKNARELPPEVALQEASARLRRAASEARTLNY